MISLLISILLSLPHTVLFTNKERHRKQLRKSNYLSCDVLHVLHVMIAYLVIINDDSAFSLDRFRGKNVYQYKSVFSFCARESFYVDSAGFWDVYKNIPVVSESYWWWSICLLVLFNITLLCLITWGVNFYFSVFYAYLIHSLSPTPQTYWFS